VACACLVVCIGVPVGFTVWYVEDYARHACTALEVLTSQAVAAPADPAANPSREETYKLYLGLVAWKRADGCS